MIQANTSAYGDSRITAPYKTESKNILQIKGGETDVVLISTLKIDELKNKRKTYLAEIEKVAKQCYNCKKADDKSGIKNKCDECKNKLKKGKVKGIPPNFK